MLTKKQKKAFKLTAVLALLLGCVMVVPFRTFSQEIGYTLDIVVKGIIIPIIILLLSISANVLKYKEIKATKLRSKTVNIMSYLPLIIYLAALSVSTLHTLLVSGEGHPASEVLGVFTWGLTFTVFVGILLLLIISTKLLNKMVMKLEKNGTIYLDLGVAIVISASYNHAFNGLEFYHKGDLALLIIYVAAFIAFFKLCSYVAKVINKDELMLNANIDDIRTGNAPVHVKNAEYKAAYEKLRKEHEAYLAANKDKDLPQETDFEAEILDEPVQEQEVEEKPVEAEVVEEQPVEEQPAEAPVVEEEVVEDNPTEEAK